MTFVYEKALTKLMNDTIDLSTADLRVLIVGESSTVDTETEVEFISGFTTLDELTGVTNYVRKALANEAIGEDLTNNRAELDADNVTWVALGGAANGTIQGFLVYVHVTDDDDSIPLSYHDNDGASFSQGTNGSNVSMNIDVEGLLQYRAA